MKKVVFAILVGCACMAAPAAVEAMEGARTEVVANQYWNNRRPFSWYYPYSYRYYTPHRTYNSGSRSCSWFYTNGTYVYVCH